MIKKMTRCNAEVSAEVLWLKARARNVLKLVDPKLKRDHMRPQLNQRNQPQPQQVMSTSERDQTVTNFVIKLLFLNPFTDQLTKCLTNQPQKFSID